MNLNINPVIPKHKPINKTIVPNLLTLDFLAISYTIKIIIKTRAIIEIVKKEDSSDSISINSIHKSCFLIY